MTIFPYSRGLIASMMLRWDHGVFMSIPSPFFYEPGRVRHAFLLMQNKYDELVKNGPNPEDSQIYEEMTGKGFYTVESEHTYRRMLETALKEELEQELKSLDIPKSAA